MNLFNLPDLGEGLPDAEIHEWFVQVGDTVALDQPLIAMETAKAVVDVPSPQAGVVAKLFGAPGDIIKTGAPLIGFEATTKIDQGTVVGNLEESSDVSEDNFTIGSASNLRARTTPGVRILAKKLAVDLTTVVATGLNNTISREDVERAAQQANQLPDGYTVLKSSRRAMLTSMTQSHSQVVPVSIFDEADINTWAHGEDITVRLIQAICHACSIEPALNAWFDNKHGACRIFDAVHLGLAMDNEEGLFVPVIRDANQRNATQLREDIDALKTQVQNRTISADSLKNSTITLSNFGKFSGRFASPIVVPPMVAILAVGKLYKAPVAHVDSIAIHPLLPLSLSFDHRAVTGGEATRFLGAVISALQTTTAL